MITLAEALANQHGQSLIDAEIILADIIKRNRAFIITHPEKWLTATQLAHWHQAKRKLTAGYPVAYILEYKEFFGLNFLVNKYTLIPRPETELMVEVVIAEIRKLKNKEIILIDVGTGTGCIPISIIKTRLFGGQAFAIDISPAALRIAKKNAEHHGVNIKFVQGNLLQPFVKLINQTTYQPITNVIITANLPYLTQKQFTKEASIQKEPYAALVADSKNGLSLYAKLLTQIQSLSLIVHCSLLIYLEIDPSQTKAITKLIKKSLPGVEIVIKKDLADRDRLVICKLTR
ncbi:MAG: peptide chain release factor N(5)-glutamine methyltransferase [bacterium]|nr:peptide chain release factor N(5)-glutamine methyltransferase [bacterium]